ncbi:hypothetical protein [Streptomyces sp. NPDC127092]|uniref:hypothetical protein n=1 Tax=Streptomyces sp. NPDC127092 TaxID=3347135 RepID=UPI003654EB0D
MRHGKKAVTNFVQSDYCARGKGATDDKPVHFANTPDDEPTVHGTTDGVKACAWHCLTYTATQALAVGAGARVLGIRLHPWCRRGRTRPVIRHALRRGPPGAGRGSWRLAVRMSEAKAP